MLDAIVSIDDLARLAFTAMYPDKKQAQAVLAGSPVTAQCVVYYACLDINVQRLLTDNGAGLRAFERWAARCRLGRSSKPCACFSRSCPLVNADNSQHATNEKMRLGSYIDGIRTIYGMITRPF